MTNKKGKTLFSSDKAEKLSGENPTTQSEEREEDMLTDGTPYMVFRTEAEFKEAVDEEIQKRYGSNSGMEYGAEDNAHPGTKNSDERRNQLIEQWQKEAAELKAIVPEFEFGSALRNETFREALKKGKSVFAAYSEMTQVPKNPERDELYQNARSPRRGTGEAAINPARLSSEDFKKYINNIKNG